jgi:TolB-like protein/DNA-binding winged helix-turn-helix (wHTH) protein/Tfp pilus assembly protein PilF
LGSPRTPVADIELDLGSYQLRRAGRSIRLQKQPMELLILLVEKQGQLVTRDEIAARLWGALPPSDAERSVNTAIRKIRLALKDDPDKPHFVQTVVGKGYRFISPVAVVGAHVRQVPSVLEIEPTKTRPGPRWIAIGAVILLFLAAGIWWRWLRSPAVQTIQAIAVLPLRNLSGNPAEEYFADGMTDELITALAGIRSLRITSRTSSMQYKASREPLPRIVKALNVNAVVEGSVVRSGSRVHITANLIQAQTDRHLWTRSYEGDIRDLISLERDVARSIAAEVNATLTPQEQARLAKPRPFNPEAYDAYLEGRFYWGMRTGASLNRSLQFFEQAIQKDPSNPLSYAGVADTYNMLADYTVLPARDALPKAKAAARKALEIDDSLAEAHASLGWTLLHFDWDWTGAEREFRRAIELKPGYASSHQWYAELLVSTGRFDDALAEMRRAQEFDPLSAVIHIGIGRMLYLARRYDQAVSQLQTAVELYPNFVYSRIYLGSCYEQQKLYAPALAEFEAAGALIKQKSTVGQAHLYAISGRPSDAERILAELERAPNATDPFFLAGVYAALGNRDRAFALLDSAYQEHSSFLILIKVFPWMDPLRSDPRFAHLTARMGLH